MMACTSMLLRRAEVRRGHSAAPSSDLPTCNKSPAELHMDDTCCPCTLRMGDCSYGSAMATSSMYSLLRSPRNDEFPLWIQEIERQTRRQRLQLFSRRHCTRHVTCYVGCADLGWVSDGGNESKGCWQSGLLVTKSGHRSCLTSTSTSNVCSVSK